MLVSVASDASKYLLVGASLVIDRHGFVAKRLRNTSSSASENPFGS